MCVNWYDHIIFLFSSVYMVNNWLIFKYLIQYTENKLIWSWCIIYIYVLLNLLKLSWSVLHYISQKIWNYNSFFLLFLSHLSVLSPLLSLFSLSLSFSLQFFLFLFYNFFFFLCFSIQPTTGFITLVENCFLLFSFLEKNV